MLMSFESFTRHYCTSFIFFIASPRNGTVAYPLSCVRVYALAKLKKKKKENGEKSQPPPSTWLNQRCLYSYCSVRIVCRHLALWTI